MYAMSESTLRGYGQEASTGNAAEMIAFWEPQSRMLAGKVSDLRKWIVQDGGFAAHPSAVVAVSLIDEARALLRHTTVIFDEAQADGDWNATRDAAITSDLGQAEDKYWGAVGSLASAGLPLHVSVPSKAITSAAPAAKPPEADLAPEPDVSLPAPTPGGEIAPSGAPKKGTNWVLWGGIALMLMAATGTGFFAGRRR